MNKLIKGTRTAKRLLKVIQDEYVLFQNNDQRASFLKPCLGIIEIGDRPDSDLFIRNKIRKCNQIGFSTVRTQLDTDVNLGFVIRRAS